MHTTEKSTIKAIHPFWMRLAAGIFALSVMLFAVDKLNADTDSDTDTHHAENGPKFNQQHAIQRQAHDALQELIEEQGDSAKIRAQVERYLEQSRRLMEAQKNKIGRISLAYSN